MEAKEIEQEFPIKIEPDGEGGVFLLQQRIVESMQDDTTHKNTFMNCKIYISP